MTMRPAESSPAEFAASLPIHPAGLVVDRIGSSFLPFGAVAWAMQGAGFWG